MKLFVALWELVLILFSTPIFSVPVAAFFITHMILYLQYKKSTYYRITKQPYIRTRRDLGARGEYLTYNSLKRLEKQGAKFLFNLFIPKNNGETTEIDVLMISTKGVFVFESKNYSGWIFGDEKQTKWYQTLPVGRGNVQKESFFNPIMQNKTHICALKNIIGEEIPTKSVIVFSNRCTLKKINITSDDVSVIYRNEVLPTVKKIQAKSPNVFLSELEINSIYNMLFPFTQVDYATKEKHIETIYNRLNGCESFEKGSGVKLDNPNESESPLIVSAEKNSATDKPLNLPNSIHTPNKNDEELRCPICNGKLVLRKASRGERAGKDFYGCSNYPQCKYLQNIDR